MKSYFLLFLLLCGCFGSYLLFAEYSKKDTPLFILNSDLKGSLPRSFRMSQTPASSSAQFSEDALKQMIQVIPYEKIMIVDLREETHGFLNGDAVSWYITKNWINDGKAKERIIQEEKKNFSDLAKQDSVLVFKEHKKTPIPISYQVNYAATEEEIAAKYQLHYCRIPVRDHTRPSDKRVDEFVGLVKKIDEKTWLHFHCSAGKGRSTTFLAMYEIMRSSPETSLEEIVEKLKFYGGKDLLTDNEKTVWKTPLQKERAAFIKNFYRYCRENPLFAVKWSDWLEPQAKSL